MSAPWDSVPLDDLLAVLVTGANSGIGLGINQKLIDDFLTIQPATSHLLLITTTRSPAKSRETITALQAHLHKAATAFAARSPTSPASSIAAIVDSVLVRIHILSIQLDLCALSQIYRTAKTLVSGTVSNPPLKDGSADPLSNVRIPKIDSVIFNAGFGGWTGIDWWKMAKCIIREGIITSCTWPDFKIAAPGDVIYQKNSSGSIVPADSLGTVFCSNVFGHYVFAHCLMPLLARSSTGITRSSPGRIIWTSSIEPQANSLSLEDIQGKASLAPYESSKRLTDVMSIISTLSSVAPETTTFYDGIAPEDRPDMYVTHPGVVASPLFPLAAWMFRFYRWAMFLCRLLGSPWHPVEAYAGATAAVWLVLAGSQELRESKAEQTKWGSAVSASGKTYVKATEVDGWGWRAESVTVEEMQREIVEPKLLRMAVGRHPHATDATEKSRQEVIETGVIVWREMEKIRKEWEDLLDL